MNIDTFIILVLLVGVVIAIQYKFLVEPKVQQLLDRLLEINNSIKQIPTNIPSNIVISEQQPTKEEPKKIVNGKAKKNLEEIYEELHKMA